MFVCICVRLVVCWFVFVGVFVCLFVYSLFGPGWLGSPIVFMRTVGTPFQAKLPKDLIGRDDFATHEICNNHSQHSATVVTNADSYDLSLCFPRLTRQLKRRGSDEYNIVAGLVGPKKIGAASGKGVGAGASASGTGDVGATSQGQKRKAAAKPPMAKAPAAKEPKPLAALADARLGPLAKREDVRPDPSAIPEP